MRVLLYGASGTGKTTLSATFPGPTLWLLCSGGSKPGELRSIDTPQYRKQITPRVVETSAGLRAHLTDAAEFKTVVLDHASGLADLLLKEILGLSELPAQKGWGLASQQQYGQLAMQCKEYLKALLNLPGNVIVIAQERVFNAKEDAGDSADLLRPTVGAALTPSVTGWLNPACDYVLQTFKRSRVTRSPIMVAGKPSGQYMTSKTGEVEYCLRCGPHELYTTKFRIPRGTRLPDVITDPDYTKIQAVLTGKYETEEG